MKLATLSQSFYEAILMPFKAIRLRYIPLLMIYFAYGASAFTSVAQSFFIKNDLSLSAVEIASLSFWVMIPWSIKMIFGQIVDSLSLFGSNRKIYVYIGAMLMSCGTFLLIALAGHYAFLAPYPRDDLFIVAMLIITVGFVLQDVVADTMSTEVTDRAQNEEERKKELATIQILARLALALGGFAVVGLGGYLASIYSYETMFTLSLFLPILSIIGVTLIKLQPVASTPLNKKIFFGGVGFALFIIVMGLFQVPLAQEIIFVVSLAIVLVMLQDLTKQLDPKSVLHIKNAMIVIFFYRLATYMQIGEGVTWWEMDVLGFDETFFGILGQIGATLGIIGMWLSGKFILDKSISSILIILTLLNTLLALPLLGMYYDLHTLLGIDAHTVALIDTTLASPFDYIAGVIMLTLVAIHAPQGHKATWFALMASFMNIAIAGGKLITKYLNEIFIITREIKQNSVIITHADYSQLGMLMWIVIIMGLIIPLVTIWKFNPDK